jgi:hypothetical protein
VFSSYKGEITDANRKITFTADGSAEFAGNIVSGDYDLTNANVRGISIQNNGVVRVQKNSNDTSANAAFSCYQGTNQTFLVNANGSATFANSISNGPKKAYNDNLRGCFIDSSGYIGVNSATGAVDNQNLMVLQRGQLSGGPATDGAKFTVKNDGSATFAGTVTANGSVLTRANGVTLDVGDRLEKVDAALGSLKTALASISDFAQLKAALVTALADI